MGVCVARGRQQRRFGSASRSASNSKHLGLKAVVIQSGSRLFVTIENGKNHNNDNHHNHHCSFLCFVLEHVQDLWVHRPCLPRLRWVSTASVRKPELRPRSNCIPLSMHPCPNRSTVRAQTAFSSLTIHATTILNSCIPL